eukprot:TRINITY_DN18881_c0_g1_i1.p1 TRINITY_DN18881_c0_g1~~TRINITY_DN18881_c0_g1_i1.p1  ORF type:complete len:484 (-),score=47.21 TRINITY_DN18881_c0_g1_i1:74-1525(-)
MFTTTRYVIVVGLSGVGATSSSRGAQDRAPLWEPSGAEYFRLRDEGIARRPVERVKDIPPEEFERRVRRGEPFIIEDAGRGNPFLGQDCEWYQRSFPSAKMRAEYTQGDSERFISVGGTKWQKKGRPTRPPPEHRSGTTSFNAPYVWHVKDGGHEAPPPVREKVQRLWMPPYFVKGAVNLREANESQEFWFSLRNGSVMAHSDTYCIPAVSLQLRGDKHWRLMPAPPPIRTVSDQYDSHDGGIYRAGLWHPTHEATVHEGEAIVFFPHQFHETFVPEARNPACTVATTFQFQHPLPVRFLRAFLPTLSNSHLYYEGHCKDLWHSFATLEPPAGSNEQDLGESMRHWQTSSDEAFVRTKALKLFQQLDSDGSGGLSAAEIEGFLAEPSRSWSQWFLTEDFFYDWRPRGQFEIETMQREIFLNRVEDILAYHDLDGDGTITLAELTGAVLQWNVVHNKLKDTHGRKPKKVVAIERQYDRYRRTEL